jgi:3-methyl-2-oxobutanoate hydroxymethyltransferase
VITRRLSIPKTICIGSGPTCDGQILVIHDLLWINPSPPPFAKKYLNSRELFLEALKKFSEKVRKGLFPDRERYWNMKPEELTRFKDLVAKREKSIKGKGQG